MELLLESYLNLGFRNLVHQLKPKIIPIRTLVYMAEKRGFGISIFCKFRMHTKTTFTKTLNSEGCFFPGFRPLFPTKTRLEGNFHDFTRIGYWYSFFAVVFQKKVKNTKVVDNINIIYNMGCKGRIPIPNTPPKP